MAIPDRLISQQDLLRMKGSLYPSLLWDLCLPVGPVAR